MGKRREGERVVSVATDGIVSVFLSSELEFFSVSWLTVFYYYCRTTRDDFAIQLVGGGDPVSNAKLFYMGLRLTIFFSESSFSLERIIYFLFRSFGSTCH